MPTFREWIAYGVLILGGVLTSLATYRKGRAEGWKEDIEVLTRGQERTDKEMAALLEKYERCEAKHAETLIQFGQTIEAYGRLQGEVDALKRTSSDRDS